MVHRYRCKICESPVSVSDEVRDTSVVKSGYCPSCFMKEEDRIELAELHNRLLRMADE